MSHHRSRTDTGGGRGSLQQIAADTGGTCTNVTDVASLPDVVPGLIGSQPTKLALTVEGGAALDISGSATPSDTTDAAGQATFTYAATQGLAGLGTEAIEGCFSDSPGRRRATPRRGAGPTRPRRR